MELTMENVKILSQFLFLSGWSVIAVYLAKKVGTMSDDLQKVAISLAEISLNSTHLEKDVQENTNTIRNINDRVSRLEGRRSS